jgi:molybdate transport system substrate-binding protein
VKADAPQQLVTFADVAGPGMERIAIANPDLAPFGRAAREALKSAGLDAAVAKRLVIAENVQQAWRYASSGNADVALTALSVVPPGEGRMLLVDPALYAPVREALGVVREAPRLKDAEAFATFVLSAANRSVFERHGFGPPPDSR